MWSSTHSKNYGEKKATIPKNKKKVLSFITPEKNGRTFKICFSFKENNFFLFKLDVHDDQVF